MSGGGTLVCIGILILPIVLWMIDNASKKAKQQPCPYCRETISREATVCPHCQRALR